MRRTLFTAATLVLALAGRAHAAAGVGASGCIYPTIAAAVVAASTGDTVFIAPGTYAERLGLINQTLTLQAANANCSGYNPGTVVIDAGNAGRVMEVASTGTVVTLRGLRLQNGNATDGGLALVRATLALEDTILIRGVATNGGALRVQEGGEAWLLGASGIYGSTADFGGGASLDDGGLTLFGSSQIGTILLGNRANASGGGVHAVNGSRVSLLTDSKVWLNVGDGIRAEDSVVEVLGSAGVLGNSNDGIDASGKSQVTVGFMARVDDNQWNGIDVLNLTGAPGAVTLQVDGSVSGNGDDGVELSGTVADFRPGVIEANGGNGINADDSVLTLTGTLVAGNQGGTFGGGIYLEDSTLTGINVKVHKNFSRHYGGGMWTRNSIFSFDASMGEDCDPATLPPDTYCSEFRGNQTFDGGGAIIMQQWSEGTIHRTAFLGNTSQATPVGGANRGSAIHDYDYGTLTLSNCLFRDNATLDVNGQVAGGETVYFSDVLNITNCTFAGNLDETIVTYRGATGTFSRNIISGNPNVVADAMAVTSPTGHCNIVHDPSTVFPVGNNNVTLDPLFVTTARGDYHLAPLSPARDACPFAGAQIDLDGRVRPSNLTDRGAFEDW